MQLLLIALLSLAPRVHTQAVDPAPALPESDCASFEYYDSPSSEPTTIMSGRHVIKGIEKLGFPYATIDPFLFCVYHKDNYPKGDEKMQVRHYPA